MVTNYLLAGGGTAGHVNPLLAVADRISGRETDSQVVVLGTAEGLEARLVPERGYRLETIPRVPLPRRLNAAALKFPARFGAAVTRTRDLIVEREIGLVIGFGGYASTPAYLAAHKEGVPFIVHEANARPGLANIWGARDAAAVGIAFPGTPLRRGEFVGMPLRNEIASLDRVSQRAEAARHFGLHVHRPVLLIFGGSSGARNINAAVPGIWPVACAAGWQLLHITGSDKSHETITEGFEGYAAVPYADRMDYAYAIADFVICRAGSATVSELTALGLPALYVPYAVGNGEQTRNAMPIVAAGGAIMMKDADFTAETAVSRLRPILSNPALRLRMGHTAAALGTREGTDRLLALADRFRL